MTYSKLFEAGKIGKLRLKNRIVMTSMGCGLAESNGDANEDIIRFYEERAKGGVGLILTEITRIEEEFGKGIPNQLSTTKISNIGHLERLAERVHKYGTKIMLQLHHPGRENKSAIIDGRQIVGPSPIPCKTVNEMPRELTTKECEDLVKNFVRGAVFAQIAGFDGVELHGAHGYLINQFLSPTSNKRNDKYGGSKENRFRFLKEIVLGIRKVCGREFTLSVRLDGDEFVEGGLKIEDTVEMAKDLEKLGVDVLNISSGTYESSKTIIEPNTYKQAWKKHLAKTVKENVNIPVIAVNNIKEAKVAESLLEEGISDYIGLARALLADSQWANKARNNKDGDITICIGCLSCIQSVGEGKRIKCAVNPKCGRENEFRNIKKIGEEKTIAVIGSGPAGLTSALLLKERGYRPVIFEKADRMGGQLIVASAPILKDYLAMYTSNLIKRVEKAKIEVRLNTKANLNTIKALDPYAVFIATGASPILPNLEGIDRKEIIKAEDYLLGYEKLREGGKVLVIGGGITGMETAETIAYKEKKDVTIVEMQESIAKGIYRSALSDFLERFEKLGIDIKTNHRLEKITEDGAYIKNIKENKEEIIKADTIVLALGVRANDGLTDQIIDEFDKVRVIGDCNKPAKIGEAVRDGFSMASVI